MALSLGRATAHTSIRAAQLNQLIDALEGASGETIAYLLRVAASNNFTVILPDNAGARKFSIKDSDEAEVAYIDSNGNLSVAGLTLSSFTFPTGTSPAQTTEGQAIWDSDDDVLTVGDGASRKTFYPGAKGAMPESLVPQYNDVSYSTSGRTANLAFGAALPVLDRDVTATAVRVFIGAQFGNIDVGIYSYDGTTFTRVVSLGSTACPATGEQDLNIADTTLSAGTRYFVFLASSIATLTTRVMIPTVAVANYPFVTKASSFPLPATITGATLDDTTNGAPMVAVLLSGGAVA